MTNTHLLTDRLSDDILHGAGAIAVFLYGSASHRRKVYYLAETKQLPCFKLSRAKICARRSTLRGWVDAQEQGASAEQTRG